MTDEETTESGIILSRRQFLKGLGAALIVIPSTKTIFDMGKNYKRVDNLYYTVTDFNWGTSSAFMVGFEINGKEYRHAVRVHRLLDQIVPPLIFPKHNETKLYTPREITSSLPEIVKTKLDDFVNKKRLGL